jgi:hypothetical protein
MSGETTCCTGAATASSASIAEQAREVLPTAELFLRRGLDLKRWWDRAVATQDFGRRFPLTVSTNRPDTSFGFFGHASVDGREMPIMGNFQSLLYDRPKSPTTDAARAARWMRDQVRMFALRYFMRVSSFLQPEAFVPPADRAPLPELLRPLSWCPEENPSPIGFGFQQLYHKEAGGGSVRPFPESERTTIVDLRRIGPEFEWILPYVQIFDFNFVAQPFGPGTPSVYVPLQEGSFLIINRDFVIDEEAPEPDLLGRYGLGYAFIKNPEPSLFAYGPGEFEAAIEIIQFCVKRDGTVRAEAIFVVNRPMRILNVPLNPFDWGYEAACRLNLGTASCAIAPFKQAFELLPGGDLTFDPASLLVTAANLLTGGLAASTFCVSLEQLDKDFLVQHFQQHYQTLVGSLQTWRQIPNWLAPEGELPPFVVTGRSSS